MAVIPHRPHSNTLNLRQRREIRQLRSDAWQTWRSGAGLFLLRFFCLAAVLAGFGALAVAIERMY